MAQAKQNELVIFIAILRTEFEAVYNTTTETVT